MLGKENRTGPFPQALCALGLDLKARSLAFRCGSVKEELVNSGYQTALVTGS